MFNLILDSLTFDVFLCTVPLLGAVKCRTVRTLCLTDSLDTRMDGLDEHVDLIGQKLNHIEGSLDAIERTLDGVSEELGSASILTGQ